MIEKIISQSSLKTFLSCIVSKFAKKSELPTKVSQLSNDSGYLTGSSTIDESQIKIVSTETEPPISMYGKLAPVRANRLAFLPAGNVIVEQSIDGGKTWTDAGISDFTKATIFAGIGLSGIIRFPNDNGNFTNDCMLRITFTVCDYAVPTGTIETDKYKYWRKAYCLGDDRYTQLNTLALWLFDGYNKIQTKVECATAGYADNWIYKATQMHKDGNPGWCTIRFPDTLTGGNAYANWRLTLKVVGAGNNGSVVNPTYPISVGPIYGFGTRTYSGNTMMMYDRVYALDVNKNATFPASVDAKVLKQGGISLADVYATIAEVNGKVDKVSGKSLSSNDYTTAEKTKLDGIAEGATKVLVDTTFSGTSDNPASSKALSTVLKSFHTDLREYVNQEVDVVNEQVNNMEKTLDTCVKSSTAATIWVGTQAEYDAIQTKDAKTVYLVIES